MATRKKKRLFNGLGYREVQCKNSERRAELPKKERDWLKANGFKNVGWESVIALSGKIDELLLPAPAENEPEDTLEELFLKAERIGNKYQTAEEVAEFNQKLAVEVGAIAAEIDRQFPTPETEFVDYRQPSNKTRRRQR